MTFSVTREQDELRRSVRRFLQARSPMSEVRRLMESGRGYDDAVWNQMADQLGLQGLHVPDEYGGQGASFEELLIVFEEMGRVLLCAPFFASSCMATTAILEAGTEAQKRHHLPRLASGDTIGTLAFGEVGRRSPDVVAIRDEHGWRLRGSAPFVLDGYVADVVVLPARRGTDDEVASALFLIDGDSAGLVRRLLPTMDQTRKQAHLEFTDVRAELLEGPAAAEALSKTLDVAAICLSAEMLGGAQRCLDLAVEYAKTRYQFGRAIGSFQAIKHKCADLFVDVESARAAVHQAGHAVAYGGEVPMEASFVKAYCSEMYARAAAENIQIHGGVGFTWEHDAHLYLKRAKSSGLLLGDPTYHRRQLASLVGI